MLKLLVCVSLLYWKKYKKSLSKFLIYCLYVKKINKKVCQSKSNHISPSKIEKVDNFTHFTQKLTHINGAKVVQIFIVATIIVYIYTATITLHFTLNSFILFSLTKLDCSWLLSLSSSSKASSFSISHTLSLRLSNNHLCLSFKDCPLDSASLGLELEITLKYFIIFILGFLKFSSSSMEFWYVWMSDFRICSFSLSHSI